MAAAFLRRTVATAGLAVLATVASPLVGTALAAGFSGAISSDPAADSSGVVTATRPTFIATYTDNITSTSTITVKQGTTTVTCPQTVSGTTVQCTPSTDLVDGKTYTVTSHGIDKADHSVTADAASTDFTIDIPSVVSSDPTDQGVATGAIHPTIRFDEALDTSNSTVSLIDPLGNPVDGGLGFSASGAPNPTAPKDTMTFSPSTSLPEGVYHLTWHAEAPGNSDAYANVFITFSVQNNAPTINPTITTAGYCAPDKDCAVPGGNGGHFINSLNEKAVPFAGTAQPGFRISVSIYDPTAPNPITGVGPNDRSANVLVPSCGVGVTICPWSLTVDTTNTPAANHQYFYFVVLQGASGSLGAAPSGNSKNPAVDPQLTKDTAPPADPQQASATEDDSTGHLEVTDADPDTSVAGWYVEVTDSEGTVAKKDYVTTGQDSGQQTLDTTLDIGEDTNGAHLVDGDLSVIVRAIDTAGNPSNDDAPGGGLLNPSKETVNLGLDIANSFATIGGQQVLLPSLNNTKVQAPTSITFQFNEPIKQTWTNSSNPASVKTTPSSAKLLSSINLPFPGTIKVSTTNDRQLVWTPKSTPTDGVYHVGSVRTFSATCTDETEFNSNGYDFNSDCEHYYSDQQAPAVDPIVTFTIDDTAPVPTFTSSTSTITAANFNSAGASGCVDADASSVQLIIKSSAEPSRRRFVPATVTAPGTGPACPTDAGKATWSVFPLPLDGIADGTLTIQAKAVDGANNSSGTPLPSVTAVLKAVNLKTKAGDASASLTWAKPVASTDVGGWRLGITDVTAGTTVTKTFTASTTSYVAKHLTNGHTYALELSDSDGNGPRAIATVKPKAAVTLTEKTTDRAVTYGQTIRISGRLFRTSDSHGISSAPLVIRPRFDNGSFGPEMKVTTDLFGEYKTKAFTPLHNATYYVSYAGSRVNKAVSTHTARTTVATRLAWTAPSDPGAVGSPVTLKGKASPNKAGRRVYIYRHTASGDHLIGSALLGSTSTWTFKLSLSSGTTTVVAKIGKTAGNTAGRSPYLRLTH